MTPARTAILFGFAILIGGNIFAFHDVDLTEDAKIPASASKPKGGRYQTELYVDEKTGEKVMLPVISDAAR